MASSFTLKGNGRLNVLKTPCGITEAYDPKKTTERPQPKEYVAIWDTGATGTVITAKVAADLDLQPTGYVTSHHAGGSSQVPTFLVNVILPNGIHIPGVRVTQATLSGNTEVLIGMDIISHGDFSFTNYNGNSCFTFRLPSLKEIDYVEESKKKNPSWLKPSRGFKGSKKGRRK